MLAAMRSASALYQGPRPIRSRAFTARSVLLAIVLRYACHVWSPAPSAVASAWQCASAPASPPRSPPLPTPTLVTKKVIRVGVGGGAPGGGAAPCGFGA